MDTFKFFKNTLTQNEITHNNLLWIRTIAFGGGVILKKKYGVRVCQGPKQIQQTTSSVMAVLTALFLHKILDYYLANDSDSRPNL